MGWGRVVIRDLTTQTTTLASVGEEFHADLATFSPDGAWLAYTSGVVGIERVGGALQVTAHPEPGGMESPAFSPDSEKVLFRTWEPLDPRDQNIVADVYLVDLDTGEVELVSANDAQSGSGNHISGAYVDRSVFSPDGSRIAFGKPAGLSPGTISITAGSCGQLYDEYRETLHCDVGTLQPGASAQLTLVLGVVAEAGATLDSVALVDLAPTLDPHGEDNVALTAVTVG